MRFGFRQRPTTCAADHYRVLELPSRTASESDIKHAYRRLARQWHPDVNKSARAPDIFRQVVEAFEILGDRNKRIAYDALFPSQPSPPPESHQGTAGEGTDLHTSLSISLPEAVLGTRRQIAVRALQQCPECRGSGGRAGSRSERCLVCKGQGDFVKTTTTQAGRRSILASCPGCGGKGVRVLDCCLTCDGSGLTRRPKAIEIEIPPGTEDGAALRLPGQGDRAESGRRNNALIVNISVQPHLKIQRCGLDLHSVVDVPLWVAVVGGSVAVPTLQGPQRDMPVPQGTQHGSKLSLARGGVLGKGAHYFTVRIAVPTVLSEYESQLLQQLADLQTLERR